jgi:hypothetical protein
MSHLFQILTNKTKKVVFSAKCIELAQGIDQGLITLGNVAVIYGDNFAAEVYQAGLVRAWDNRTDKWTRRVR